MWHVAFLLTCSSTKEPNCSDRQPWPTWSFNCNLGAAKFMHDNPVVSNSKGQHEDANTKLHLLINSLLTRPVSQTIHIFCETHSARSKWQVGLRLRSFPKGVQSCYIGQNLPNRAEVCLNRNSQIQRSRLDSDAKT